MWIQEQPHPVFLEARSFAELGAHRPTKLTGPLVSWMVFPILLGADFTGTRSPHLYRCLQGCLDSKLRCTARALQTDLSPRSFYHYLLHFCLYPTNSLGFGSSVIAHVFKCVDTKYAWFKVPSLWVRFASVSSEPAHYSSADQ